jgi:hypothetical protein
MPSQRCNAQLELELSPAIEELGRSWFHSLHRPSPSAAILEAWSRLLGRWAEDPCLPLLVRKPRGNRGAVIWHQSGRMILLADNSPAHWAFAKACRDHCPKEGELLPMLEREEIPVAMAMTAQERNAADYRAMLRAHNVGSHGWKLAHLRPVGLRSSVAVEHVALSELQSHFIDFLSPSNHFVVPTAIAGLAEVEAFLRGFHAGGA